jgi:hypothetical protein
VESSTSLHAFGDIVGYSRLNAFQQAESQERLARIMDDSLLDAGISPNSVLKQDQGDARFLTFPANTDVAKVLAIMPRRFSDDLRASNRDAAPHARLRIRLSFVFGAAASGVTGYAGNAAIAVVRLSNALQLRDAMRDNKVAELGVIVDQYLYQQFIMQGFRPDLAPEEYQQVQVVDQEKNFQGIAWIRLVGYHAREGAAPPEEAPPSRPRTRSDSKRARRRILTAPRATIIAGIIGLLGVVLPLELAKSPESHGPGSGAGAHLTQPVQPGASGSSAPGPHTGRPGSAVLEYADWRPGVAVYASNSGSASDMSPIPFNQGVRIACVAPNNSGIASINKFYLISSGRWKGTYASANEFTNGGPRESASDASIDKRIHSCPASQTQAGS